MPKNNEAAPIFIDLFAGCGGLSLGLFQAGWQGLCAIEQSPDAFKTLSHNLVNDNSRRPLVAGYDWPSWLAKKPIEISTFLNSHREELLGMAGTVTLVAGGPPCQGFSFAGRREANDPRNQLFKKHLEIVDILKPPLVLLENVQGIKVAHGKKRWIDNGRKGRPRKSYADKIKHLLEEHGYLAQQNIVRACDYGVPQLRPRYITIGIRRDLLPEDEPAPDIFKILLSIRKSFLQDRRLPVTRPVTVAEAISDLQISGQDMKECTEADTRRGFKQISKITPTTIYQHLMHGNLGEDAVNSLRLPKHRPATTSKFKEILQTCRKGVHLSSKDRERLGIKKSALVPLSPSKPSHTLTTLPDDMLHYCEPRIHTVREHARLQSFPDWFDFLGKYTTGGKRRTKECPRYSQVGNAVPPLLAEALGIGLLKILNSLNFKPQNSK